MSDEASQKLEYRQIDDLTPWEDNPRTVTPQDLARLINQIKKLGQYKPLIIDEKNVILGGNMRYRALKEIGVKEVWVSVVHPKTESERVEYALSDNDRIGITDEEALAQLLMTVPDVDLSDFKVDLGEATSLGSILDRFTPAPDEDDVPEPAEGPAKVQRGEVYQLGKHRLMCGDATNPKDMEKLMGSLKARMVFTDPPYNVNYKGAGGNKRTGIMNDSMPQKLFAQFLQNSIRNMMNYCDGAFYVCMSQQEIATLKAAFQEAGGHWQDYIVWVKNVFVLGGGDYQKQYELIMYGWNDNGKRFRPEYRDESDVWMNLEQIRPKINKMGNTVLKLGAYVLEFEGKVKGKIKHKRDHANIWEVDRPAKSIDHPTQKPVKLITKAIKYSSERGDIVLDPFSGSGSTLIAAEQAERACCAMELDPKYCDVIIRRWEELTKGQAHKISD